jgi:hypothetical protein
MIRTELSLRLPNSPGALAAVTRLLSDERVNILAIALEPGGQLRLVVDNHVHGGAVLREHHHQVAEHEVIVTSMHNAPGRSRRAESARRRQRQQRIAYGGGADGAPTATIVLRRRRARRAPRPQRGRLMKLYVETMGRFRSVRVSADGPRSASRIEEWSAARTAPGAAGRSSTGGAVTARARELLEILQEER